MSDWRIEVRKENSGDEEDIWGWSADLIVDEQFQGGCWFPTWKEALDYAYHWAAIRAKKETTA